jgi:hypothetical protein
VHPSAEHVYLYFFRGALSRARSSSFVANARFFVDLVLFLCTTSLLVTAADVARVEVAARRRRVGVEAVVDVFFFFAFFAAAAAAASSALLS